MHVSFRELDTVLARAGAASDAAEAHGTLAGWIASGQGEAPDGWLHPLLEACDPRNAVVGECREFLVALHRDTRTAFASDGFDFTPMLPDDSEPLAARVDALAEWCQGFLYGLTLAGVATAEGSSAEVREIVDDFAQLGRAGLAADGDPDEEESAYTDLVEYVRVGAQLVHDELALRAHGAPTGLH